MAGAKYAYEIDSTARDILARAAERARPAPVRPRSDADVERNKQILGDRVFVRGRFTPEGLRWDVLKVEHGEASLYAKGLTWRDEAIQMAIECMSGKVFSSVAGARALLNKGANGLLAPSLSVDPRGPQVHCIPVDGKEPEDSREIEIRRGLPPKQQLLGLS